MRTNLVLACAGVLLGAMATSASADKIDDIISAGVLRCAVTLDAPPFGFRNDSNEPQGFDVDTCGDLANALGVKAEIVDTPYTDRIPAIVSNRADVGVAQTSDTLERARSIGFSIPYFVFENIIVARDGSGIDSVESMKGKVLGATAGAYEATGMQEWFKKNNDTVGSFRGFQTQADVWLALSQGQIDATWSTNTNSAEIVKSGKYPNLKIVGKAPLDDDYVALIAERSEYGLINYINLFLNRQVRTGRYQELFKKWVGGDLAAPVLTVQDVYR